jgi:hypothetical protein
MRTIPNLPRSIGKRLPALTRWPGVLSWRGRSAETAHSSEALYQQPPRWRYSDVCGELPLPAPRRPSTAWCRGPVSGASGFLHFGRAALSYGWQPRAARRMLCPGAIWPVAQGLVYNGDFVSAPQGYYRSNVAGTCVNGRRDRANDGSPRPAEAAILAG